MSNYQLAYKKADGEVITLPARINKYADINDLKRFAEEAGYGVDTWENREGALSSVFGNVTLQEYDTAPENINLNRFKNALKDEPGLFELDWEIFQERFDKGVLNTVVDGNGSLIATMNVMPKLNDGIKGRLEITDHPDNPQVFETGAGWTAPEVRGLGVYTKFRDTVLESAHVADCLLFSQARGKGASNVNIREGWTLVNWEKFPFASALMGWPRGEGILGNKLQLSSGLELKLPTRGLYKRKHIDFAANDNGQISDMAQEFQNSHNWDLHHHLWTNDYEKLEKFEKNIKRGLGLDPDQTNPEIIDYFYANWLTTIQKNLFVMNQEMEAAWDTVDSPENTSTVS